MGVEGKLSPNIAMRMAIVENMVGVCDSQTVIAGDSNADWSLHCGLGLVLEGLALGLLTAKTRVIEEMVKSFTRGNRSCTYFESGTRAFSAFENSTPGHGTATTFMGPKASAVTGRLLEPKTDVDLE